MQARLRDPCRGSRRQQASPPNRPAYNRPRKRAAASGNIQRHNTPHRTIPANAPPLSLLTQRPTHAHTPDTPHHPRHSTTRTHPPRGAPRPAARPPHPVARTRPPRTPQKTQAQPPPAPECSRRELFPPADANPHNLTHCRTPAQPSPEGEGHNPVPPSPGAADQIRPPGRQVTTGPPQPAAPDLPSKDMPSILPAVAAAKAAAHKPARITAQPASTTSSSSSASSTSPTSSSDPPPRRPHPQGHSKSQAAAPRTGPPTPTQATQAPPQRTGKTPDPTSAPSHLRTEVLLNTGNMYLGTVLGDPGVYILSNRSREHTIPLHGVESLALGPPPPKHQHQHISGDKRTQAPDGGKKAHQRTPAHITVHPAGHLPKDFGTERHIVLEGQAHHIITAALYTLAADERHSDPTTIRAIPPPPQGPQDPVTPFHIDQLLSRRATPHLHPSRIELAIASWDTLDTPPQQPAIHILKADAQRWVLHWAHGVLMAAQAYTPDIDPEDPPRGWQQLLEATTLTGRDYAP